jgi:signal transduction histidine kinase
VLIVTFGATSVWIVSYIDDLGSEIGVVRTGYLKIALVTKDLAARQQQIHQYLKEELADGAPTAGALRRLRSMRTSRATQLDTLQKILEGMQGLPRGHGRLVERALERVAFLRRSLAARESLYEEVIAAVPAPKSAAPVDPAKLEAARKAIEHLIEHEHNLVQSTGELAQNQQAVVERIAINLERNATRLRGFTFAMSVTSLLLGLFITVWVTIMLRPLARLRDAAKRIARGEHGMRIDERGPAEVADVAREFNVMALAIEERERELVRSERLAAVGKMAAMITHEVRNPLSSIALNTELLGDELDELGEERTREARALCRAITDEVDRLTAITEEYLAFARLPKPRLAAEPVNPVVESLAQFVKEDLAGRSVQLEVELDGALPRALLDEAQIRQSLLNLVRNAAEALGGEGGTITLSTRRGAKGFVEIEVRDDGPGIPEPARGRLFDPFFSTKEGGTGLGLALTHQIVRDHGGEIRVESQPGAGASFVVSLPEAP